MSEHCTVVYKQRPYLKGQCLEFCFTFFNQKTLFGPYINRQKQASQNFRFRKDIHKKRVSAWSLTTQTHGTIFYFWNRKTNDKSNTEFKFIFLKIVCSQSRCLRWHRVRYLCGQVKKHVSRKRFRDYRPLLSNIFAKTKKFAQPFWPVQCSYRAHQVEDFKQKRDENLEPLSH